LAQFREAQSVRTAIEARKSKVWPEGLKVRVLAYLFLTPTFAFILVFSYYPAIRALIGAFTQWDGFNAPIWVGLANFIELFKDPIFLASTWHIALWAIIGIPLSIIPSFVVAELIFHLRGQGSQYVYRTVFIISMVLPAIVGFLIWQYIYEPTGLLNSLLLTMGLGHFRHDWIANGKYALASLILLGFPWVNPFNLLVLYAGLQGLPGEILNAAEVDGASAVQRVVRVDVPMVFSQFKLLLVLGIIGITQNLVGPLIMTGGGPGDATMTPVLYMYQTAVTFDQYGYSMAIAFVIFVVVMVLAILNIKYFRT